MRKKRETEKRTEKRTVKKRLLHRSMPGRMIASTRPSTITANIALTKKNVIRKSCSLIGPRLLTETDIAGFSAAPEPLPS